jgi:vacuolar-type H+-ATPase subunit H
MTYDDRPFDADADAPELAEELPPAPRRTLVRGRNQVDAEELLRRVADLIAAARPMPLSASAMINKEEVLELLEEAIGRLPDELREARWLRKERDEYLAKMRTDGDEITEAARARAEQMVQRTEVVKAAEHRARRIIESAEAEARRLRLECEDFCDQKLASFEIVLERTLKLVASGREKLQATNLARPDAEPEPDPEDEGFFDQDRS